MRRGRRLLRAHRHRAARTRGFEAALGLLDEPPPIRRPGGLTDLRCARCDGDSRLESLDLRTSRGLARCERCDASWSILYPTD